jgi:hypothetical protein
MKAIEASMFLGTPFWLARDWHVGRKVTANTENKVASFSNC